MRIRKFHIKAFGHFTDLLLDFTSQLPGFHIIFGPNEAGKSTALRALRGLLFGIDNRSTDNFLHDHNKLMLGGHIDRSDERELIFWRIKKNTGSLLDRNMKPLDHAVFGEFLDGLSDALFDSLFCINHETLVTGGRDILEQKGDVGQALFSAGAGLSSLHLIIDSLHEEAARLYKPLGSNPEINKAMKQFKDIKKYIHASSISSSVWKEKDKLVISVAAELLKAEQERNICRTQLERLKRLRLVLPELSKRRSLLERIGSIGSMNHMPEDFLDRLTEANHIIERSNAELKDALSRRDALEKRLSECVVRQDILDQTETMEALQQRLGVRHQAQKDRPAIEEQMHRYKAEAAMLINQELPDIEPDNIEKMRPLISKSKRMRKLRDHYVELRQRLLQTESQAKRHSKELLKTEKLLHEAPPYRDISGLVSATSVAAKAGDIDAQIRAIGLEIGALKSSIDKEIKHLKPWQGTDEDILSLPAPSYETVNRFDQEFRDIQEEINKTRQRQQQAQEELKRVEAELRAMEIAGTVPTEGELFEARSHRDSQWQLVKRSWLYNEDITADVLRLSSDKTLHDIYEETVLYTDNLSDRLRNEAERIHKHAHFLAQSERLKEQITRAIGDESVAEGQWTDKVSQWLELWRGFNLNPMSPKEMSNWLLRYHEALKLIQDRRNKEDQRQAAMDHKKRLRENLIEALSALGRMREFTGDEIEPVLNYSEQVIEELRREMDGRRRLEEENLRLRAEAEAARTEMLEVKKLIEVCHKDCQEIMQGFISTGDATPEDAASLLEILKDYLNKIEKVQGLEQRLKLIDEHHREFSRDVEAIINSTAPELKGIPPEQAVVRLYALMKEAGNALSLKKNLAADLEDMEKSIRKIKVALELALDKKSELMKAAKCETEEELREAALRLQELMDARQELRLTEQKINSLSEGIAIEELERQALEKDPNSIPGEIEALDRRLREEIEPLISSLSERKGAALNELERINGQSKAAEIEEEAQNTIARISRLAGEYVRLRIAGQILKREIDRYRMENQDPLLSLASHCFSKLTLGAFETLKADNDRHGSPTLIGICPNGRIKRVSEMSSGTRDQLYLALRIAAIKWRLQKHEPIPFIADDILVNFDDSRTEATLKTLAELSEKNQVILFTHHYRITEAAMSLDMDDRVFVHKLA